MTCHLNLQHLRVPYPKIKGREEAHVSKGPLRRPPPRSRRAAKEELQVPDTANSERLSQWRKERGREGERGGWGGGGWRGGERETEKGKLAILTRPEGTDLAAAL